MACAMLNPDIGRTVAPPSRRLSRGVSPSARRAGTPAGQPAKPALSLSKGCRRYKNRALVNAILLIVLSTWAFAQSRPTIRHHREIVDDTPPEIAQAEDAIQKNNFTGAEPLLKKAQIGR